MKFTSHLGKAVRFKGGVIVFKTKEYETSDKDQISALENAKGVTKVQPAKKTEAE